MNHSIKIEGFLDDWDTDSHFTTPPAAPGWLYSLWFVSCGDCGSLGGPVASSIEARHIAKAHMDKDR